MENVVCAPMPGRGRPVLLRGALDATYKLTVENGI
jgi:hypothetical protein